MQSIPLAVGAEHKEDGIHGLAFIDAGPMAAQNVPSNIMQQGPADDRMFVVDAINKLPYSFFFRSPY